MKYMVLHCTFDYRFNHNPFWHSALCLLQWDETLPNSPVQVMNNDIWGYYGLPSTSRESLLDRLKISLMDVDMIGNHGMLKPEDWARFMDKGWGLHGTTFEITKEQYEALQQKFRDTVQKQQEAIKDFTPNYVVDPSKLNRIYSAEHVSRHIFALEKELARQQNRPSRLHPFEFVVKPCLTGLDLTQSYTCKSMAVDLLRGILPPEQIDYLTERDQHPTVPRLSGEQEPIYMYSNGPLKQGTSRSGKIFHNRDSANPCSGLYLTLPPQVIIPLPGSDLAEKFRLNSPYCQEAREVIEKLQKLEWLFNNAQLQPSLTDYCKELVNKIRLTYQQFAIPQINRKPNKTTKSGIENFMLFLLNQPRNHAEQNLLKKITQAKDLFNTLYTAIVDDWEINFEDPLDVGNETESIAAYLNDHDKKALCKIIGRTYHEPTLDEFLDAQRYNR